MIRTLDPAVIDLIKKKGSPVKTDSDSIEQSGMVELPSPPPEYVVGDLCRVKKEKAGLIKTLSPSEVFIVTFIGVPDYIDPTKPWMGVSAMVKLAPVSKIKENLSKPKGKKNKKDPEYQAILDDVDNAMAGNGGIKNDGSLYIVVDGKRSNLLKLVTLKTEFNSSDLVKLVMYSSSGGGGNDDPPPPNPHVENIAPPEPQEKVDAPDDDGEGEDSEPREEGEEGEDSEPGEDGEGKPGNQEKKVKRVKTLNQEKKVKVSPKTEKRVTIKMVRGVKALI